MNEVVIIGGGIIGLSTAFELQSRGLKTCIVDPKGPGTESSWAAAGMLAPQIETTKNDASWVLGRSSRNLYSAWIDRIRAHSNHDPHYHQGGALVYCKDAQASQTLWETLGWQRESGELMQQLSRTDLQSRFEGLDASSADALYFPKEAQVDPRELTQTLVQACTNLGTRFRWGESVTEVIISADSVQGVQTVGEKIETDTVVVAAGAWTNLIGGLNLMPERIVPVRGQMLALELQREEQLPLLTDHDVYIVSRRNGRALIGSTMENVGFERGTTEAGIRGLMDGVKNLWPELAEAKVLETWSGFRPKSADDLPLIGPSPIQGLHLAAGHFRNGILYAPLTAELVADLMMDEDPAIETDAFACVRAFEELMREEAPKRN